MRYFKEFILLFISTCINATIIYVITNVCLNFYYFIPKSFNITFEQSLIVGSINSCLSLFKYRFNIEQEGINE